MAAKRNNVDTYCRLVAARLDRHCQRFAPDAQSVRSIHALTHTLESVWFSNVSELDAQTSNAPRKMSWVASPWIPEVQVLAEADSLCRKCNALFFKRRKSKIR